MLMLSKSEFYKLRRQRMNELFEIAGDRQHLALMLNKSPTTIESWVKRGCVDKSHAIEIEAHPLFGKTFKALYLRPDLFCRPMSKRVQEYKRKCEEMKISELEDELDEINEAISSLDQDFADLNVECYEELEGSVKRDTENSKLKRLYEELRKMKEEHIRTTKERLINESV